MHGSEILFTLIGGPTLLIEFDGLRFLTDPTFDPPGLYQEKPVRFEKLSGPAISPEEIGRIDAVLLSHDQHFDNLDRSGRDFLPKANQVLTTLAGAERLGGDTIGLAPFEKHSLAAHSSAFLTATPARHGPVGVEPLSGDVIGFVLSTSTIGDLVYVTGDTLWYEGTAKVAKNFSPQYVVLNAGAAEPRGRFHMTMGVEDALEVARAFPDAKLIAIHNEGWAHLRESQDQLAAAFTTFGLRERLLVLERGVPVVCQIHP